MMRKSVRQILAAALLLGGSWQAWACGTVAQVGTGAGSQTRYSLLQATAPGAVALMLLPGGSGHLNLDAAGCPQALKGNSLVRAAPLWQAMGFHVAMVDARSDWQGEDGLAGFRVQPQHAQDLARVAADLRQRTGARQVWVIGTSRGAISAANLAAWAAAQSPAPVDGVVLTSAVMAGQPNARLAHVRQSVFDLPLADIRLPLLLLGHAGDACPRSPAALMQRVADQVGHSPRKQVVTVTGGTPGRNTGLEACEGRSHHGFWEMEADMAAGIARFVGGGSY